MLLLVLTNLLTDAIHSLICPLRWNLRSVQMRLPVFRVQSLHYSSLAVPFASPSFAFPIYASALYFDSGTHSTAHLAPPLRKTCSLRPFAVFKTLFTER